MKILKILRAVSLCENSSNKIDLGADFFIFQQKNLQQEMKKYSLRIFNSNCDLGKL